ncbi:hypothetical protein LTR70_002260 [Exophiala xenobiotica]|uniref:C2H2-type domain-containing protein n=1 Tax=Lithohypha guttulata TaxID=1690604 RepID=A0ABR0KL86_9EURO|nr:hypothetical protein LTR24_001319 [Lithohypha guttulata]KAK5325995.1 hypothetical protein LTR70_002260 [Exophiala xenobiotica]
MSFDADYSTLEEYLELERSLRSPTLQRSNPNFDCIVTPPPLVDAPEDFESSDLEDISGHEQPSPRQGSKGCPRPSLYDALLIRQLGPHYPTDIAERAGTELFVDNPDVPCEDWRPDTAHDCSPMIKVSTQRDVSITSSLSSLEHQALTASRRASAKLNDAIASRRHTLSMQSQQYEYSGGSSTQHGYVVGGRHKEKGISISITSVASVHDSPPHLSQLSLNGSSSERGSNVLPPLKPVLPSLYISNPSHAPPQQRHDSESTSPALARFAITPASGHSYQTLAKLQNHQSPTSAPGQTPSSGQTLPSLETALNSATDSNGTPYIDVSPAITRPSPSHHSHYALSPAAYSQATSVMPMSPPRLSSNPASWRALSQNSSVSTNSDHASGHSSNHASTPATRPSPSHSDSQYPASEHEGITESDLARMVSSEQFDRQALAPQGYWCTFPGCTAPPFQTQYLLNSHTNVHSNQRPHFCPVKSCPRGPGGQGFKRKNEMIRHGLVHTSPGYVCPFCPDQQHKYPRPDNLQRHVRVHHVDRDRDDPLLRDVLAQRPEGGNRGRRRRLGG